MKRRPLLAVLLAIVALVVTPLAILARQQPAGPILPNAIHDVVIAPEYDGVMDQHVDAAPAWESITPESDGYFFEEVQSIPTNGAFDWESFVIDGETYLAVANEYNDSTRNIDSKIYKWNGSSFIEVQSIPTSGAHDWKSFVINGETYLAVANEQNGSTFNIDSKIYKWNGSSFVEVQSIPTSGAYDWKSFVINGEAYLAVANNYNDSTRNIDSKIYKWNGSSFVEIQSIPTNGAHGWESFVINGEAYLAVANHYNGSTYNIDSKIYKWNGSSFVEVQSIPTSGALNWESFVIDGETYLAVANQYNGSYNINSKIYKWNGSSFVEAQSIPTSGAPDWESFVINGEAYLAVANHWNDSTRNIDSKIYKWNGSSFVEAQSIPTSGALDWESFVIDGEAYLAVASYRNDSTYNVDSKLYKWNGPTKLKASFTATPQTGPAPLTVKFTDQSPGKITSRLWSFGDGGSSTDQNPTHTYIDPGAYTVSLAISGPSGSDTETKNDYITVTVPPPAADFTGSPTSGSRPLTVKFLNASTGEISSCLWDFGNGESSQEQNPYRVYTDAGTYTVKLTVTGAGGSNTKEKVGYITVTEPKPKADFSADPTSGVKPLGVTFTSKSGGTISSYWWDFGDGVNSSTQNPVHAYNYAGTYSVSLKVTGPGGTDTKKIDKFITVKDSPASQFTLTVTKAGTGAGAVTSFPAGIDCGSDCAEAFNADVGVTLKAQANKGSVFKGWSGGSCSGTGNCVVKMTRNIGVTAKFDVKSSNKPDLVMTLFSAPVTAVAGKTIQIPNTVKNQGKVSAGPFTIGIYLSKDKPINPTSDILLESRTRVSLGVGEDSTAATSVNIPANITIGTYYIGAMADTKNVVDESDEANNTRLAPKMIRIVSPLPDLIVTDVSGPATAKLGQAIEVFDGIKNAGKSDARDAFSINIYLSKDADINIADDYYLGNHGLSGLSVGQTARKKIEMTIPSDIEPGTYYLGVWADSEDTVLESNENNNIKSSIATIQIKK